MQDSPCLQPCCWGLFGCLWMLERRPVFTNLALVATALLSPRLSVGPHVTKPALAGAKKERPTNFFKYCMRNFITSLTTINHRPPPSRSFFHQNEKLFRQGSRLCFVFHISSSLIYSIRLAAFAFNYVVLRRLFLWSWWRI